MKSRLTTLEVRWVGVTGLICHRGGLADPLDKHSRIIKKLSAKRKKTDEDYIDLSRAEFEGSFYWSDIYGPAIPTDNILSVIVGGAKRSKMGREANLAIFCEGIPANGKHTATGDSGLIRLEYDGPRTVSELWGDGISKFVFKRGCKVGLSRIMRTRPIIPAGWSLHFYLKFDPNVINQESVIKAMEDEGFSIGLCDWRPRYGTFEVEILN